MGKEDSGREKILAAIRRAAAELGRAPSRGELRRITGVSHYRVLAEFSTLREAVRAAGLEPNPKGEKISTEDLLADWKRVAEKLGRRPSRAEYVREGRYSAGAFVGRFGSWGGISTAKVAKSAKEIRISRELTRRTRINQELENANHKGHPYDSSFASSESLRASYETQRKNNGPGKRTDEPRESVLHDFDRVPLAAVPSPLVGMRKVTEAVAQMVVNTLLGDSIQRSPLSTQSPQHAQNRRAPGAPIQPTNIYYGDTEARRAAEGGSREALLSKTGRRTRVEDDDLRRGDFAPRGICEEDDLGPSLTVNAPLVQDDGLSRGDFTPRGIRKDRPVMGEPFDRSPMTNAPVNELGVMVLFGMVAVGLGLQVESVQGKFPDCVARRQVAPGKWQYLRIEFEYESKNFKLHGHDPKGCDMIVCWRHNWKECPAEIEVVELSRLVGIR
ncbi:MAG: homing endonuclease associated repeat-containing protein [Terriglobales bacterium]